MADVQVLAENIADAKAFIFAVALDDEVKVLAGGDLVLQAFLKLAVDDQMLKKVRGADDSQG
jgi:hypothetical protein